jgi:RNA polymerase sigma-70 factor, ECF subfamily
MGDQPRTVTMLLRDWREGDRSAFDQLVTVIYAELRKLAVSQLRRERPDHTLRPTELVGEAFARLVEAQAPEFEDRVHFFGIAARVMRQILVDHARKHKAEKRGGGVRPEELGGNDFASGQPADIVALDEALQEFVKLDESKARVIELHYFGGLKQAEIAVLLDVHVNTVARNLRLGEAWLRRYLCGEPP